MNVELFRTMLNTQPFSREISSTSRHGTQSKNLDRSDIRAEMTTSLPSLTTKRKLSNSLIEELKIKTDSKLLHDFDPLSDLKIKRARLLDMNKIRPLILADDDFECSLHQQYLHLNCRQTSKQTDISNSRAFRLPWLTNNDYVTNPTIEQLCAYFNEQGQCSIKKFTVTRNHYGSITFQGANIDLAGLDLNRLIQIDHGQVTVYPNDDDRPEQGNELNCQAIISLFGIYPIDRTKSNNDEEVTDPEQLVAMNYANYLEIMTGKFNGTFLGYDVFTGTWKFQVEHF